MEIIQQPGMYEFALVAAGVCSSLLIIIGWSKVKPWWGARQMRAEQEKKENAAAARYMWYAMRNAVMNGDVSADHGAEVVKRVSNILPDILPGRKWGNRSLKELLAAKFDDHVSSRHKEETTTAEVKDPPKRLSLLRRLVDGKSATAPA